MKIVFLAPFGIRPKGTVIARMLPLAVELQALGHTVAIVAPPYTNPEDSGKVEVVSGVRLINVALPASKGKAWTALLLAWRMFRTMHAEQPEIIHLFKPKGYGGLAAMLHIFLQRLGVRLPPIFLDTDDWEGKGGMNDLHAYSGVEKRVFAFQEQWLSLRAAGVTVASRTLAALTAEMGVTAQRILYLPNGVVDAPPGVGGPVREKLGIAADASLVLLYTRFFEFSQERLYQVFAGIFRTVPGVRFLVVGKGRNREEEQLVRASRDLGFESALVMAGWVEPRDIPSYLAAADVAIYPLDDTLVNRAKCPAKLTELLLAGVPVVADAVGQAAEYITDGVSGLLCDPGDAGPMVSGTVRLLRKPATRSNFAMEGRRYLLEHVNWHDAAVALGHFYRRVTNP